MTNQNIRCLEERPCSHLELPGRIAMTNLSRRDRERLRKIKVAGCRSYALYRPTFSTVYCDEERAVALFVEINKAALQATDLTRFSRIDAAMPPGIAQMVRRAMS